MALPIFGIGWGAAAGSLLASSMAVGVVIGILKVVAALGVGIVVYSGVDAAFDLLTTTIQSGEAMGGIPSDTLAILTLGGIPEAVGIILSAFSTRFSIILANTLATLRFGGRGVGMSA